MLTDNSTQPMTLTVASLKQASLLDNEFEPY